MEGHMPVCMVCQNEFRTGENGDHSVCNLYQETIPGLVKVVRMAAERNLTLVAEDLLALQSFFEPSFRGDVEEAYEEYHLETSAFHDWLYNEESWFTA